MTSKFITMQQCVNQTAFIPVVNVVILFYTAPIIGLVVS